MRRWLPRAWKYAAAGIAAAMFVGAATLAAGQFWVITAARPLTYAGVDEVPAREVALVPGVGGARKGRPPRILAERLRIALALYRAHKVGAILVSGVGDGSAWDEAVEMRRWLVARGVPAEHILVDPAGYRTLDTMRRAADLLRIGGAVVCTQSVNMSRSLFLARSAGIDAVGLVAPSRSPASAAALRVDALKTVLAIADIYVLHRQPRVSHARGMIGHRPLVAARSD